MATLVITVITMQSVYEQDPKVAPPSYVCWFIKFITPINFR